MVKQSMDLLVRKRRTVDFLRESHCGSWWTASPWTPRFPPIGAQHGERSPERVTYRNGYRYRTWDTPSHHGVAHSQAAGGQLLPQPAGTTAAQREGSAVGTIQQAYVEGVSTRRKDEPNQGPSACVQHQVSAQICRSNSTVGMPRVCGRHNLPLREKNPPDGPTQPVLDGGRSGDGGTAERSVTGNRRTKANGLKPAFTAENQLGRLNGSGNACAEKHPDSNSHKAPVAHLGKPIAALDARIILRNEVSPKCGNCGTMVRTDVVGIFRGTPRRSSRPRGANGTAALLTLSHERVGQILHISQRHTATGKSSSATDRGQGAACRAPRNRKSRND